MYHAIDARTLTHIPTSFPSGPYMVIRDRKIIYLDAAASQTLFVFGEHRSTSDLSGASDSRLNVIGKRGLVNGSTKPSGMTLLSAENLSPFLPSGSNTGANIALHAMTISVSCTSSALNASGAMYYGTLRGTFHVNDYETTDLLACANALQQRPEIRSLATYATTSQPAHLFTGPLDAVQHAMFNRFVNASTVANECVMTDSVMPMVLILPQNMSFQITVYTEWRVIAHASPTFSSLHTNHKPAPQNLWQLITGVVSDNSGILGTVGNAVSQAAGSFVRGYMSNNAPVTPVPALPYVRRPLMLGN